MITSKALSTIKDKHNPCKKKLHNFRVWKSYNLFLQNVVNQGLLFPFDVLFKGILWRIRILSSTVLSNITLIFVN